MIYYIHLVLEIFSRFLTYIILVILLLVSVAFITLMEQNILGRIQIRFGPIKVGYLGILQPFADAVKLFVKETIFPYTRLISFFFLIPVLSLFLVLSLWLRIPLKFGGVNFEFRILYFICIRGAGTFPILAAGWASNSKYSLLGGLRAVAQIISYEVSLITVLLRFIWLRSSFDFFIIIRSSFFFINLLVYFPLRFIWFASILAETNRTPYDFSEGESELVSGFNTEYRAGGFTLIFMSEYARIIFIRILFSILFLSGGRGVLLVLKGFIIRFMFVWVRGTMPRFRYDKLINLAWKRFLPVRLLILMYFLLF